MSRATPDPYSQAAIGERILLLREALGYTQVQLAIIMKVTSSAVGNWEQGTKRLSIDCAYKLASATGVSFDWLYRGMISGLPRDLAIKVAELRNKGTKPRS